ncbi:85/ calcium-independent phospholipase A2 [Tetrabaena socialis]|uniref:85/ calcium-independent phospholipase A2 n=1 Tax=Tetrabaena socialis TaxID=47790 RepID=A0A2J8AED4_9CHLO|nr:85/ calcium-independent phospholipase A2 [Tetrabaena socialis]|eukprot:PNH10885.1 85/ calcium-independent phospholipase A2 [Tetrabaena socialis]
MPPACDAPSDNNTALHVALDLDVVEFLLLYFANTELRNKDGRTPLMLAAARDNAELVDLLLVVGSARTEAKDSVGPGGAVCASCVLLRGRWGAGGPGERARARRRRRLAPLTWSAKTMNSQTCIASLRPAPLDHCSPTRQPHTHVSSQEHATWARGGAAPA